MSEGNGAHIPGLASAPPNLLMAGSMFIFYDRLPSAQIEEFSSRMIGDDWHDFGHNGTPRYRGVKRFGFNSLGRLHRALELLSVGMSEDELCLIRVSLVDTQVDENELLLEAAQGMEFLGQLLRRVRAGWLHTLLQRSEQFFNVFQPLVKVSTGRVYAYEMLIRAHADGTGGVIGGAQLAEAALASNLIYSFDLLAREVAIRTAASKLHTNTKVFINFMPNTVFEPEKSLEKTLEDCRKAGLPPERVVFEVIESESISDIHFLKDQLNAYRELGFKVALDDLGSGYSGLNYMLELMPDFVKVDQEMVLGIADSPSKRVIVSKLTEAAHDLGITVVAEGVERLQDFDVVRALGIDLVQGYYFARPSADKIYDEDFNLIDHTLSA